MCSFRRNGLPSKVRVMSNAPSPYFQLRSRNGMSTLPSGMNSPLNQATRLLARAVMAGPLAVTRERRPGGQERSMRGGKGRRCPESSQRNALRDDVAQYKTRCVSPSSQGVSVRDDVTCDEAYRDATAGGRADDRFDEGARTLCLLSRDAPSA